MNWDLATLMKQALDKNKKIIKKASDNIIKNAEPQSDLLSNISESMVGYLKEASEMNRELRGLTLKKKCILAKLSASTINDTPAKRREEFEYDTLLIMAYHKESEFTSHEHYEYLMKIIDVNSKAAYETFMDSVEDYTKAKETKDSSLLEESIKDMARFRRQYLKSEAYLSEVKISEAGDMSSFDELYNNLKKD